MKKATEQDLVRQCLDLLRLRRVMAWRQNQGAMTAEHRGKRRFLRFAGVKGISDIIGVLPDGRFLAVECKIRPNKPTEDQARFLADVQRQGGVGVVVYAIRELDDILQTCVSSNSF